MLLSYKERICQRWTWMRILIGGVTSTETVIESQIAKHGGHDHSSCLIHMVHKYEWKTIHQMFLRVNGSLWKILSLRKKFNGAWHVIYGWKGLHLVRNVSYNISWYIQWKYEHFRKTSFFRTRFRKKYQRFKNKNEGVWNCSVSS